MVEGECCCSQIKQMSQKIFAQQERIVKSWKICIKVIAEPLTVMFAKLNIIGVALQSPT